MQVIKRDGSVEDFSFDKITARVRALCNGLHVDPVKVTQAVAREMTDRMTTHAIDLKAADSAASLVTTHPDYATLSGRIAASDHQKSSPKTFAECMHRLEKENGDDFLHPRLLTLVDRPEVQAMIRPERDFLFDDFAFRTLMRSYLLKGANKTPLETPQYMYMRVALFIWGENMEGVARMYDNLSMLWYTHATPTLFNAGLKRSQMSSCFLEMIDSDSVIGIYKTITNCARISQHAGGMGISIHNVRAKGAPIRGTNGISNGLVPMLKVFEATARYIDQGGGKRMGSFAMYIEPWHSDIMDVLTAQLPTTRHEIATPKLFYGLWVPDLFMRRLLEGKSWTLFSEHSAPGLSDAWGPEFDALYEKYEREGRGMGTIDPVKIWELVHRIQVESSSIYVQFKDAANRTSNQRNLGTIKCSNLCTEIMQYTSPDEIAVCNLASLCLPRFVRGRKIFDFERLAELARELVVNLNRVIDLNYYPLPEAERSNRRHRPIGVGVQGLHDVFQLMRMPFDSPEARELNKQIFETIEYACLHQSCELARVEGTYETYAGSPASKGELQMDMWPGEWTSVCPWLDWPALRARIAEHGLRNSLLTAPMPTASTSQICGNSEGIDSYVANIFDRKVLAGAFTVVNRNMVRDLEELGKWTPEVVSDIVAANGSVKGLSYLPEWFRAVYRTAFEIPQKSVVQMAADRGRYIDQSQSLNIFLADKGFDKFNALHFAVWRSGLSGSYYVRYPSTHRPIQYTLEADTNRAAKRVRAEEDEGDSEKRQRSVDDSDVCLSCT